MKGEHVQSHRPVVWCCSLSSGPGSQGRGHRRLGPFSGCWTVPSGTTLPLAALQDAQAAQRHTALPWQTGRSW